FCPTPMATRGRGPGRGIFRLVFDPGRPPEPRPPGLPCLRLKVVLFSEKRYLMFDRSLLWKWLRGSGKRRAPVRKPIRPRLSLEALEDRTLLSVTATFSAATGVLTVAGDDLDNTIVVSRDAAGTILVNNGAVAIQGGQATIAN